MASRRTPIRQWEVDRRCASQLINRLKKHIMAEGFPGEPEPLQPGEKRAKSALMNDSQVRAALGLLKKYMPDLKSIELTGNPDHPVVHEIRRVIIDSPHSADGAGVPAAAGTEPV